MPVDSAINFISSFFVTLLATPAVKRLAVKKDWVAKPVKERWHKKTTALFGGIAIYLGIAIPLFIRMDFSESFYFLLHRNVGVHRPPVDLVIFVGMSALFVLGLIDDFLRIKPHSKLIGQILAASLVVFLGFRLHWFESLTLDVMVTFVWIVGVTNAFNLIDNMDGLCAGIGAIASLFLGVLFTSNPFPPVMSAFILAGALTAFLIYNFNPASIFMGDCGSLVIGFTLAVLCLHYTETAPVNTVATHAVPVMMLLVPILDTTMVSTIRILSGRKASMGGKDHTSHRLVLLGLSEKGAVLFLYGIGVVSGLSALFVHRYDTFTSPAVIIPLAVAVLLMGIYLSQIRVYPEKEFSILRDRPYTPILLELTYKKQIVLIILDFALIGFSYFLSYRLRFDSDAFPYYFVVFLRSLPAVIACKFFAFYFTGIYRGFWSFLSSSDVFVFLKASVFASLLSIAAVTFIYRFRDFSKGIFLIDWLLTTALLLGTRGSFRISMDAVNRKRTTGKPVLIYGAGRGGEILLRELLHNPYRDMKPVGFIDDDIWKSGRKIQGFPILGGFKDIKAICGENSVEGILISFSRDCSELEHVMAYCRKNHLFLKRFEIEVKDIDCEDSGN